MVQTHNLATLAGEAHDWFERATRPDGEDYTRTKDDAPEWVGELVRSAHGEFLPNDWRYEVIAHALSNIHDNDLTAEDDAHDHASEFADECVDAYSGDRIAWLASHGSRASYCEDAASEGLFDPAEGPIAWLGAGQYMEASEVYALVVDALVERLAEIDEEAE
jgi:hypothetical protein